MQLWLRSKFSRGHKISMSLSTENFMIFLSIFLRIFLLLFRSSLSIQTPSKPKQVTCSFAIKTWSFLERELLTCEISNQAIYSNDYTIVPPIIPSKLSRVQAFNVAHNKDVKFIPENLQNSFRQLFTVQVFNCSLNIITEKSLQNLTDLVQLHLLRNVIETIEKEAFRDLSKLEWLSLAHNEIEVLHSKVFTPLVNLKFLDVSNNKIQFVSSTTFFTLQKIEFIDLGSNQIRLIDENLFRNAPSIRNITLDHNMLERVDEKLFISNTKLEYVWLYENNLKVISSEAFGFSENLKYVDLRRNSCQDAFYYKGSFEKMKNDLRENCLSLEELRLRDHEIYLLNLTAKSAEFVLNGRKNDEAMQELKISNKICENSLMNLTNISNKCEVKILELNADLQLSRFYLSQEIQKVAEVQRELTLEDEELKRLNQTCERELGDLRTNLTVTEENYELKSLQNKFLESEILKKTSQIKSLENTIEELENHKKSNSTFFDEKFFIIFFGSWHF